MNRREMMKEIAKETIEISEKGQYQIGNRIYDFDIQNNSKLFTEIDGIMSDVKNKTKAEKTTIEVKNENTVDAIFRLSKGNQKNLSLGVLNFASAYNPGGGFQSGAIAQEECLAYCSDLYLKQIEGKGWDYYRINKLKNNPIYTDTMFMSNVTFFRNGNYHLIPNHTMCNVLTCPAVNINALKKRPNENISLAKQTMKNRMRKILYLFAYYDCRTIVLGAYGCGVFGNRPEDVAKYWYELLYEEGMKDYFEHISFSILDKDGKNRNIETFKKCFQIE